MNDENQVYRFRAQLCLGPSLEIDSARTWFGFRQEDSVNSTHEG